MNFDDLKVDDAEIAAANEDASVRRNYIVLAFMAIFAFIFWWIANSLDEHNRALRCFEEHRHDCVPLDTSVRGAPR